MTDKVHPFILSPVEIVDTGIAKTTWTGPPIFTNSNLLCTHSHMQANSRLYLLSGRIYKNNRYQVSPPKNCFDPLFHYIPGTERSID